MKLFKVLQRSRKVRGSTGTERRGVLRGGGLTDKRRLGDCQEELGQSSEQSTDCLGWPRTKHGNPRQCRGTNDCSAAQRWPRLKLYTIDLEHQESLGMHCNWEKRCPEGGRGSKKTGDATIKSRGYLNRANVSAEGHGMNRGMARGKRGWNDRAGSQTWTQEVCRENERGARSATKLKAG